MYMKLTLDIPDEKAAFVLELIGYLSFVEYCARSNRVMVSCQAERSRSPHLACISTYSNAGFDFAQPDNVRLLLHEHLIKP